MAWLVIFVIPLQGFAAMAAVAAGPLHTHVEADVVVLVDFRRAFAAPTRAVPQPMSEWQHAVSHALPQRHVHAPSDASVVEVSDPLTLKQQNKADMQAALFVAIVPAIVGWVGVIAPNDLRPLAMWSPTTADERLTERPPRAA